MLGNGSNVTLPAHGAESSVVLIFAALATCSGAVAAYVCKLLIGTSLAQCGPLLEVPLVTIDPFRGRCVSQTPSQAPVTVDRSTSSRPELAGPWWAPLKLSVRKQ